MKKMLIGCMLAASTVTAFAFAEEFDKPVYTETTSFHFPPKIGKRKKVQFNVIPYAQIVGIFPGGGVLMRAHSNGIMSFQIDAMAGWGGDIKFSGVSVAPVIYPFAQLGDTHRRFNIGVGVGAFTPEVLPIVLFAPFAPYFPLFVGYHKEKLFIELNTTIATIPDGLFRGTHVLPGAKIGFSF